MWNALSNSRHLIWLIFGICVAPVLVAIWWIPWFVTVDGPAHTYNAYILIQLLKPNSSFGDLYTVRSYFLPNVGGHFLLMGLMSIFSGRTADRFIISLTFVGFASSIVWLRWQVAGRKGIEMVIPLSVVLGLNWMWTMGFYNFLLGGCLFSVTLGIWWAGRETMRLWRAVALAGLLVVGYLCHLVTLGLTVVALMVLALTTSRENWLRRCIWTGLSLIPLIPLIVIYHGLMRQGGEAHATWTAISKTFSLGKYIKHLLANDPIRIIKIDSLPFVESHSPWFILLSPAVLVTVAILLLVATTIFAQRKVSNRPAASRRAWAILPLILFIGWLIGPDDFGEAHGLFLRERVLLLGLVSLVPILVFDLKMVSARLALVILATATAFQIAATWDYALSSNRWASDFVQAKPHLGTGQRVKTLLVFGFDDSKITGHFRDSPLFNLSDLFGVDTENIIWDNYEAISYIFPVGYRDELTRKQASKMVNMRLVFPNSNDVAAKRLDEWSQLLAGSHTSIDMLVVWGNDPTLNDINKQWYDPNPVFEGGKIRVFRHR